MTQMAELPGDLFAALGIAAFARGGDGAFSAIAPIPAWFAHLVGDGTFPFLGYILEEAGGFWSAGTEGPKDFGPCAEVDEAGREFHYTVTAVSAAGKQYLLFQLDPAADRLREVLQKARELSLRVDGDGRARSAFTILHKEAAAAADEIRELTGRLRRGQPSPADQPILQEIAACCDRLRACVENMAQLAGR
jgi:hypothetical protein